MAELQISTIRICKEDLSGYDTGGAIRELDAKITVDSSLPLERQRENLIHEILGVYLGSVLDTDILSQIAQSINEAIEELIEHERIDTEAGILYPRCLR